MNDKQEINININIAKEPIEEDGGALKPKVFIDGRTEAYGGKFFKEYKKMWERWCAEN